MSANKSLMETYWSDVARSKWRGCFFCRKNVDCDEIVVKHWLPTASEGARVRIVTFDMSKRNDVALTEKTKSWTVKVALVLRR